MGPEDLTLTKLDELLSKLGDSADNDPWTPRLNPPARIRQYRRLAYAVGPRYAKATLNNYQVYDRSNADRDSQEQCVEYIRGFCEVMPDCLHNGGGLIFFGRPGTGKDHLMVACMYWATLRHGFSVLWRDGPMLAQEIRDRIGGDESERQLVDRYVEPQILAISDPIPPKGDTSAWVTDTLQRIIDRRYRACKSTWATINVRDGAEAEQRLAPPLVDRLRHGSLCLQCEWESYRGREKGDPTHVADRD